MSATAEAAFPMMEDAAEEAVPSRLPPSYETPEASLPTSSEAAPTPLFPAFISDAAPYAASLNSPSNPVDPDGDIPFDILSTRAPAGPLPTQSDARESAPLTMLSALVCPLVFRLDALVEMPFRSPFAIPTAF